MDECCVVPATWDAEAAVWVAESDDVPGPVAESPTLEALGGKLLRKVCKTPDRSA